MPKTIRILCLFALFITSGVTHGQGDFPELLPHYTVATQWSPQADLYVTSHVDGSVRVYDSSGILSVILNAHSAPITGSTFSPDGSRLATGGYDNDLRIWNVFNGMMVAEFLDLGEYIETMSWSPDGTAIWAASTNGIAYVISADTSTDSYTFMQEVNVGSSADGHWNSANTLFAAGVRTIDISLFHSTDYTLIRSLGQLSAHCSLCCGFPR